MMKNVPLLFLIGLACTCTGQNMLDVEDYIQSVGEHRIIGLGEQRHGVETFNDIKSSLLDAASRNYPESCLLVESSFNLSMIHFLQSGNIRDFGENVLFQFWNADTVLKSMEHFNTRSLALNKSVLAGFDMAEDCRYILTSNYLIESGSV